MRLHRWQAANRLAAGVLAGMAIVCLGLSQPARAADLDKLDNSLKLIPANAAFYTSALRTGEQIKNFLNSKAWAKLKALPGVQMALKQLDEQLKKPSDPQLAAILQLYNQPENQQLVQLLGDMCSHEIFCYGGDSVAGFTSLVMQVQGFGQYGRMLSRIASLGPQAANEAQVGAILQALADNLDLVKIPDFVIGFRLSKADAAEPQLKRLEALLTQVSQQVPLLQGRVKREKVAGASFLTVSVDASLVPWQQVNLKQFETKPGEFDKLLDKLKQLKLTVGLGVRDNYLLLTIGDSVGVVSTLGSDKRLIDRPEMKYLEKHAAQPLTSIAYVGKALRGSSEASKKGIDSMVEQADALLKKAELPADLQKKIRKDLGELAQDAKSFIHETGPSLSFSFSTPRGQEDFSYDWSQYPSEDGTKPLTLLNHVGGSPILAVVGRSKYSPESYQLVVKWIKTANNYFEELALPRLNDEQKGIYEQVSKILHPFMRKLDTITGTLLLPSLKDGQAAFVLDGKLKSKQWHQQLPTTDKELPILEPALVLGVSDAPQLRKAVSEYRTIINELITKLHELNPQVPDFQIPDPETRKVDRGTLYYYPLPGELGIDKQLQPNAGLADEVAVLSISPNHSERLLSKNPLKLDGGPLADLSKPLAGAVYFDFAGLMTSIGPWIHFAGNVAIQQHGGEAGPWKDILGQVDTVLEVFKCFRGYSAATYMEDGVRVTHGEMLIKDL